MLILSAQEKKNSFPGREGDDLARRRYRGMSLMYPDPVCIGHIKKGTLLDTPRSLPMVIPIYKTIRRKISKKIKSSLFIPRQNLLLTNWGDRCKCINSFKTTLPVIAPLTRCGGV
jgi:hypothetical protein